MRKCYFRLLNKMCVNTLIDVSLTLPSAIIIQSLLAIKIKRIFEPNKLFKPDMFNMSRHSNTIG